MKKIHRLFAAPYLCMSLCLFAGHASAQTSHFSDIVVSDSQDATKSKEDLPVSTPVLFLHADFSNVKPGTKLTAQWIAVKAKGVPANYKIDAPTLVVGGDKVNLFRSSLTRHNNAWPAGDYKVDLYVGDHLEDSAKFTLSAN
jgi:hypothetical protein